MSDLDSQVNLKELFRQLADSTPCEAPGSVETRLRAVCRARHRQRRWRMVALVTAASLMLALGLGWHAHTRPPMSGNTYAEFTALPYGQSDVPIEQAIVVRVDLQHTNLEALGLPAASVARGKRQMHADLLIGQDGIARAVRLTE